MTYRRLSAGEKEVSKLCLGTGGFGTAVPRAEAFAQMDLFFERGGNFFDSARVYADWVPGGHGASEKTLGAWISERKTRDDVVISTKGAHPDLKTMNIPRMGNAEIRSDLEESLKALGTDYIDIYLLHRDDLSRPVEEILTTLEACKNEGKIRHYGCSNWTRGRMEEAERIAARRGFEGFICDQIWFGLGDINRAGITDTTMVTMDRDLYVWHGETNKAVMAYTSSCHGWFSRKLLGKPVSPAQDVVYDNEPNRRLLGKLPIWERELGAGAAQLVSAWVMSQSFPAVAISSFSSLGQLEELSGAADIAFPPEILGEIAEIKKFVL
ncbi:MAG: aldo/keto reductase [Treponema sp.]|jgi:aryl-alcohol dehydrogenase-like predicted oxidoreductase|nr:aldo/keto reductase [Treponema sp.]